MAVRLRDHVRGFMMQPTVRGGLSGWEVALGLLVVIYLSVSVVAYIDFPRRADDAPLTNLEQRGLAVWRGHNCQACHQIYGFGGFLGPDLTNRVTDATPDAELGWILESGSGQMPAFDLPSADQEAILAYLRAVNRSGQSQPDPLGAGRVISSVEHYGRLAEEWAGRTGRDLSPTAGKGLEVWRRNGCGVCHLPFAVGRYLAPDLSQRAIDRSMEALQKVLDEGRARMPPFHMARDDIEALTAFLQWFAEQRSELVDINDRMMERQRFSWSAVPWWEYR